ncbi:MAG: phospholipase D family protein [Burkholderiaceae bacterium]
MNDKPYGDAWGGALRAFLVAFAMVMVAGCATLPKEVERQSSEAVEASQATTLGKIATISSPAEELSGFRLMPVGSYALNTRVTLARMAEKSLDVQYYLVSDDQTGRYLLRQLRDAALRGVRVRLLVDDLYSAGEDSLFLGLRAYPNVEVRLFNPFPGGRSGFLSRFAASPFEIERLNHRMHNKLFVADGAMAVAGGRNIADEYFQRSNTENFVDLDSFVCGAVVPQLEQIFDDYWNSEYVYPLESIAHTDRSQEELREDFERRTGPASTPDPEPLPATDTLGYGPLADDLERGRLGLTWAPAFAYADRPSKISMEKSFAEDSVQYNLLELMRKAKSEVDISSPYLIPGPSGMSMIRDDRKRGVTIKILTNSLAATDEPVVHIGYSHYRRAMLDAGVELAELSPSRIKTAKRLGMFGTSIGRLHAKLAVIDRQTLFIGSMNFDPRSAHKNTELGIIIESKPLAKEVMRLLEIARYQSAYTLRLMKNTNEIEWLNIEDDDAMVQHDEPDSGFWLRLELELLTPLAPEELL